MGQNVAANLRLSDDASTFDFFGLAKIVMVESLDEAHPIALAMTAASAPVTAKPRDETPFRETQLVFANNPQMPVIDTDKDVPSGYQVKLFPPRQRVHHDRHGSQWHEQELALEETRRQVDRPVGDGDPILFRVAKYWPDFAMKDGAPISVSDQPRNPPRWCRSPGRRSCCLPPC